MRLAFSSKCNKLKCSIYLKGIKTIRIAFSCTCHPNINEAQAQITTDRINCFGVFCLSYFSKKSFATHGSMAIAVIMKVVLGLIAGNQLCSYSWTKPPVFDFPEDLTPNIIEPALSAML